MRMQITSVLALWCCHAHAARARRCQRQSPPNEVRLSREGLFEGEEVVVERGEFPKQQHPGSAVFKQG
eukprot:CAMPEP_0206514638 /NCGR_PEP_ID=MMETSP0324_2-20121206/62250_1 /ASSEMBLY_ACC=CAM_ASM_000836 /TAXON_ID=2866 /ORGANISM="Crypthecodinium cohnii, Strain Seligo" /LENGTH=67 /DNA_ID=CAMNT_0054007137 /DNA_START=161 /DNA_END=360 /DNA_ORIENTATION=-